MLTKISQISQILTKKSQIKGAFRVTPFHPFCTLEKLSVEFPRVFALFFCFKSLYYQSGVLVNSR